MWIRWWKHRLFQWQADLTLIPEKHTEERTLSQKEKHRLFRLCGLYTPGLAGWVRCPYFLDGVGTLLCGNPVKDRHGLCPMHLTHHRSRTVLGGASELVTFHTDASPPPA